MKQYILSNLTPIAIGFALGLLFVFTANLISDTVVKIALIQNKGK